MLASKNRLKKKINFVRIEIDGTLHQSKSFGMCVYDRRDEEPSRFGFIISTKISKKAVIRNKIKRIMAEVVRNSLPNLPEGLDVLFLIKPSAVKIEKNLLERETHEILFKNLQKHSITHL